MDNDLDNAPVGVAIFARWVGFLEHRTRVGVRTTNRCIRRAATSAIVGSTVDVDLTVPSGDIDLPR